MELFKFNLPDTFLSGEAINGWDSVSWVERYRETGEFEIIARLSSGLKAALPIGTLISRVKSFDIMIVENHQITEDVDLDPILKITGRSLVSILEQRVVGQAKDWSILPGDVASNEYLLPNNVSSWAQATMFINDHIHTANVITPSDGIPNLIATDSGLPQTFTEEKVIKRNNVLTELIDLLEIDDLGVRVIRRHAFPGYVYSGSNSKFVTHPGVDKRNSVIFSVRNGDIESADYLWSIKNYKNAALVAGKFIAVMVPGSHSGLNKRVMLVDASDIDGHRETMPTGAALTTIRAKMTVRGKNVLKAQKRLALSRVDISETPTYEYRKDYNIGDLVSVDSSYGDVMTMRVVEFVEIADETGENSHPTLEILDDVAEA